MRKNNVKNIFDISHLKGKTSNSHKNIKTFLSAGATRKSRQAPKRAKFRNWKEALRNKSIGLDSLMNLSGLNSFTTDQQAMDDRIRQVLAKKLCVL